MAHDEILVIGAGIGGLTTALSLAEAGFRPRVFESVQEVRPIGAGINLLPHAVRELFELGLQDALEATAVAPHELAYFTKRGERIWAEPRGIDAGYRWPQLSLHRGVLQQVLLDAARDRLGSDRIHLGHHLTAFQAIDGGVRATFGDRATGRALNDRRGPLADCRRRYPFRRAGEALSG